VRVPPVADIAAVELGGKLVVVGGGKVLLTFDFRAGGG
jgi:hypothetical protein